MDCWYVAKSKAGMLASHRIIGHRPSDHLLFADSFDCPRVAVLYTILTPLPHNAHS